MEALPPRGAGRGRGRGVPPDVPLQSLGWRSSGVQGAFKSGFAGLANPLGDGHRKAAPRHKPAIISTTACRSADRPLSRRISQSACCVRPIIPYCGAPGTMFRDLPSSDSPARRPKASRLTHTERAQAACSRAIRRFVSPPAAPAGGVRIRSFMDRMSASYSASLPLWSLRFLVQMIL